MEKRLRIAYVTSDDPHDQHAWSGSTYYIAQALQKHCGDVVYLGPIRSLEKRVGKVMHEVSSRLFKKNIIFDHTVFVAKKHAKIVAQRLEGQEFDVIVAPIGTTEVAFLQTDLPIVLIKDATFALLQGYNHFFSNLWEWSGREGNLLESMAYEKASALLYPAAWAANSALNDYHVAPEKVHVLPFGANLEDIPPRERVLEKKKSDRCRLLFVGANGWKRKGGEIAYEALLKLEEMGIVAELIMCGCTPPPEFRHERLISIPFLNKNDTKQRQELEKLYAMADFLLVPTRYDCFGIAFCEANGFAVPVITTNTGGVPGVIRDGENGFLLPYEARGAAYAEVIARLYRDDERYNKLVHASRAAFDERLNWDAWGISVRKILTDSVEQK